jgi:translation initiation factor 2B subunit (eIF-2B alpha/beta/delta family)
MTHLKGVIRDVEKFIPKPISNKKLKRKVLSELYAIENREKKSMPKRRQVAKQKGFIDSLVSGYKHHKENQSAKRIEKAHIISKIRNSNLPEQIKEREQAKLGVPVYKEDVPTEDAEQ